MKRPLAFLSLSAVAALVVACVDTTATTTLTPITGIIVRSESLTAGHGCGTGDGQIVKYRAGVQEVSQDAALQAEVQWGLYDCFADATFTNLETNGSEFVVTIEAFDAKALAAATSACTGGPSDGPCYATHATLTTSCTAVPQSSIQVLAVCGPLHAP